MSGLKCSGLTQTYTICLIALLALQSLQTLGEDIENSDVDTFDHYYWVRHDVRQGRLMPNAALGGRDIDGSEIYVGRAYHNGDLLPAKVVPGRKEAYVSYNSKEYIKYDVEVLIASSLLRWVKDSNGHVPPKAIAGGRTASGETLYIGRCNYKGGQAVGKIHPSLEGLYFPFGGGEYYITSYEVLEFYKECC